MILQTKVCPTCKKDDKIEKVSVIVADQTKQVLQRDWDHVNYGTQQSDLAALLTMSPMPKRRFFPLLIIVLGIIWSVGGTFIFGMTFISIIFFALFFASPSGEGTSALLVLMFAVLGITASLLPTIILGVFCWRAGSKARKKDLKRVEEEMVMWNNAKEKWNRLYFCFRDGIVFDPVRGNCAEKEELKTFIYA